LRKNKSIFMDKNKRFGLVLLVTCLGLLQAFACKKTNDPGPELSISDVSQVRNTSGTTMTFHLRLTKPTAKSASVDYSTAAGTATSLKDYEEASGTMTIAENVSEATIDIKIKGDPLDTREPNLNFNINLTNPKNCTIKANSAIGTIITEDGANLSTDNAGYTTPLTYPGYTLVWSDEFSGASLNSNTWNQETGNGSGGWGNNELEFYTDSPKNTFLSNGNLIIEARMETTGNFRYTSGRMTTQGKKTFKFGRIDIRAKLPVSKGLWPALWMLGANITSVGWPLCGETDIMELVGTAPSTVVGTLHWGIAGGSHMSKGANYVLSSGDFSKEFHVFSIIWQQNSIQWLIDDQSYLTVNSDYVGSDVYPFNADQFFIFNVAVGGNWPGPPDYTTVFPQRMFVDYVRVFQ
jgi:beta-glucanase (GH16 family)